MTDITIMPCPFCLHDDVVVEEIDSGQVAVVCPGCGACGPDGDDTQTAVAMWNSCPGDQHLDPAHAAIRLQLANLTGAGRATLEALHKAGGYVVFDPRHQAPINAAMRALEFAVRDALAAQVTSGD